MRRRRNLIKKLLLVAGLLILCFVAGLYLVKMVGTRAEEARKAQAEAEAQVRKTQAEAEAKAKIISAEAEAEANKKLSDSIDANVLLHKYYETWDGKLPTTLVGDDAAQIMLSVGASEVAKKTAEQPKTTPSTTEAPKTETTESAATPAGE